MITTNIDGNPISQGFISALTQSNRNWQVKLLQNGNQLDCDIISISVSKGSSGSSDEFAIGEVVSSSLTAVVQNLNEIVKGTDIEYQVGINDEYISLGTFRITDVKKNIYKTTLMGYGNSVTKTGGWFDAPSVQSLENIRAELEAECGCDVTLEANDSQLVVQKSMAGLTTYQALKVLATVVGGYATDLFDGTIAIKKYNATPTLDVNNDRMINLPEAEDLDYECTGVECYTDSDDPLTAGTVNLSINSEFVTEELFNSEIAGIIGYKYRPATIGLTLGDPRLQGDDVLNVTDIDGAVYIVPCHQVTHIYTGGLSTQVTSSPATPIADDINTVYPITGRIDSLEQSVGAMEGIITFDVYQDYGLEETTLTAVVMKLDEDITEQFPPSLFTWSRKTESGLVQIGTGYSITVQNDTMGFGGVILAQFDIDEPVLLKLPDGNYLVFPNGDRLMVVYKGVI